MATLKYVEVEEMKAILKSHKYMCSSLFVELAVVKDAIKEIKEEHKFWPKELLLKNLNRALKYLEERGNHYASKLDFLAKASDEKLELIDHYLKEMEDK